MKKIEVFLRQCYYSKLQELPDRTRPDWFNKTKVFENFKNTIDPSLANYTIVYDEFYGNINKTFLGLEKNVEIINCGSECDSFLRTLEIIRSRNFDDDQIIYFLEDDYLHKQNWCNMILEGFTLNPSYLTLYDFSFFTAKGYLSEIFITENSHWRAIPATTNTFACRYKTLLEDFEIHKKYSSDEAIKEEEGLHFSKDYEKFLTLQKNNKYVISPIPGWSTHCEKKYLSPLIDWKKIIDRSTYQIEKKKFTLRY